MLLPAVLDRLASSACLRMPRSGHCRPRGAVQLCVEYGRVRGGVLGNDAPAGEHVPRRGVPGNGFAHRRAVQHDQVGVVPGFESVSVDAHDAGRSGGDSVEQQVEPRADGGAEQVCCEEHDFQHVLSPERIVGVLAVVLAERDEKALGQKVEHGQVQRAGVRVADEAEPSLAGQAGEAQQGRLPTLAPARA